jgi:hypothetical protein
MSRLYRSTGAVPGLRAACNRFRKDCEMALRMSEAIIRHRRITSYTDVSPSYLNRIAL